MADGFAIADFLVAEGVGNWRVISDGACAFYPTASFQASAQLVEAIGGIDGIDEHPPNVNVSTRRSPPAVASSMTRALRRGGPSRIRSATRRT